MIIVRVLMSTCPGQSLEIENTNFMTYSGILLIIIIVYRILFWTVLVWKK